MPKTVGGGRGSATPEAAEILTVTDIFKINNIDITAAGLAKDTYLVRTSQSAYFSGPRGPRGPNLILLPPDLAPAPRQS